MKRFPYDVFERGNENGPQFPCRDYSLDHTDKEDNQTSENEDDDKRSSVKSFSLLAFLISLITWDYCPIYQSSVGLTIFHGQYKIQVSTPTPMLWIQIIPI